MTMLILGVALWWAAHFFKRLMPGARAAMGDAGKAAVAVVLLAGIVLMVLGFRAAPFTPVWQPPTFMVHVNNLLVLVAIFMLSPAPRRGALLNGMRHPMLTGFSLWAIAHLLVNGDLAAIVLFGGLLIWAVLEMLVINAAEPAWQRPPKGTLAMDGMFLVASLILMAAIGYVHSLIGPWPFAS